MKLPLVQRECGECSLCCTVLGVDGMYKAPKSHCMHEMDGGGCHIYKDRPSSCRKFGCAWLNQPTVVPNWARPLRSGLILVGYAAGPYLVIYEAVEGAFSRNLTKLGRLMAETGWSRGFVVILDPFRGNRRLVGGPADKVEAFIASEEGSRMHCDKILWED